MNFQSRCVFPPLPLAKNAKDDRVFQKGEIVCLGSGEARFHRTLIGKFDHINQHNPKIYLIEVLGNAFGHGYKRYMTNIHYENVGKYYPISDEISLRSVLRQPSEGNNKGKGKRNGFENIFAEKSIVSFLKPPSGAKSRKARRGGRKTRRNKK